MLKGIANVDGVNRLMPKASLTFCPKSLTVIYGKNGSGKSGFVRILRTACRTRINSPAKLKVLADVYGDGGGVQAADIVMSDGSSDFCREVEARTGSDLRSSCRFPSSI